MPAILIMIVLDVLLVILIVTAVSVEDPEASVEAFEVDTSSTELG